jgi:hypothetical protein
MPRRPKAVALTGAQIDAILELDDAALRDAIDRLKAEAQYAESVLILRAEVRRLRAEAAAGVQADDGEA